MNRQCHLGRLWRSIRSKCGQLRAEIDYLQNASVGEAERRIPILVIDGLNRWAGFARAFYLSSAIGATTIGGKRVYSQSAAPVDPRTAIISAIQCAVPRNVKLIPDAGPIDRRLEPAWHDPNVLIQATTRIPTSNASDVISGFSPFPTEIMDWSCLRNFFAHRNQQTYQRATKLLLERGVVGDRDVCRLLLRPRPSGAKAILSDWISEVELRCEYLCA